MHSFAKKDTYELRGIGAKMMLAATISVLRRRSAKSAFIDGIATAMEHYHETLPGDFYLGYIRLHVGLPHVLLCVSAHHQKY
jgi:hypothetical protein